MNPTNYKNGRLRRKLLASHLVVGLLGIILLAIMLAANLRMRRSVLNLTSEDIPATRYATRALIGVNQSLAELRAWVLLGRVENKERRRQAWDAIHGAVEQLRGLVEGESGAAANSRLAHLRRVLSELEERQWWIEDVAGTPGNEPARLLYTREVKVRAEQLVNGAADLIESDGDPPVSTARISLLKTAAALRAGLLSAEADLAVFLDSGDELAQRRFESGLVRIQSIIGRLPQWSDGLGPNQRTVVRWLKEGFHDYERLARRVVQLRRDDQWNAALYLLRMEAMPLAEAATLSLSRLASDNNRIMMMHSGKLSAFSDAMVYTSIGLLTIMIVFALAASYRSAKHFTAPIERLTTATADLVELQSCDDVPVASDDEIGQLTQSFNEMKAAVMQSKDDLMQRAAELSTINAQMQEEIESKKKVQEQLIQAREAAEQANRTKSEFLTNMSHELRSPMNAIIGYSEMLADRIPGDLNDKQSKYIDHILNSGRHLLQLINDILDISKIEAGRMELAYSDFDPGTLVKEVVGFMDAMARKKQITLAVDAEDDAVAVTADKKRLKQCLYNLVSNAVKFTPEGGVVTVNVEKIGNRPSTTNPEMLRVSVTDSGIGIATDDLERVFGKFEQLDSSYARQQEGTGLGLAITKKIIELHGGRIRVESEGEGKGAAFVFEIPLTNSADPGAAPANGRQPAHDNGGLQAGKSNRNLILVIEDDRNLWDLISDSIENGGFHAIFAENGDAGVRMAGTHQPDVILLDMKLPDKDGWQVLNELKRMPATRAIPVVVLSVSEDKKLGLSVGIDDWLVKPVDPGRLLEVLSRAAKVADKRLERILVIDDDPVCIEMLADQLAAANNGYEIIRAFSGREGLGMARQTRPDVIILDLLMPDLTGFEVVDRLNRCSECRHIPVIINTARELTETERLQLGKQAYEIIAKNGGVSLTEAIGRLQPADELECDNHTPELSDLQDVKAP